MTKEQKAKQLIEKFGNDVDAVSCVDEILLAIQDLPIPNDVWDYWQDIRNILIK